MTHIADVIFVAGLGLAVAAAVRSTWSPCGLSMLSTITPFGERARGYRYPVTALWFVAGATVGGASLGAVCAALAAVYGAAGGGHAAATAALAALALTSGAGVDGGMFGPLLPVNRRQVNERWLTRYRRWVYAGGFGWQIGCGVATYVMTSALFTMMLLAAISASPLFAMIVCTLFGMVRGLAVLLTAAAATPGGLRLLHRRMEAIREPVRWATVAVQVAAGLAAAATGMIPAAAVAFGVPALMVFVVRGRAAVAGRINAR